MNPSTVSTNSSGLERYIACPPSNSTESASATSTSRSDTCLPERSPSPLIASTPMLYSNNNLSCESVADNTLYGATGIQMDTYFAMSSIADAPCNHDTIALPDADGVTTVSGSRTIPALSSRSNMAIKTLESAETDRSEATTVTCSHMLSIMPFRLQFSLVKLAPCSSNMSVPTSP